MSIAEDLVFLGNLLCCAVHAINCNCKLLHVHCLKLYLICNLTMPITTYMTNNWMSLTSWSRSNLICRVDSLWTQPTVWTSSVHCQLPHFRSRHSDNLISIFQLARVCFEGYPGDRQWDHINDREPSQLYPTSKPFLWPRVPCTVQHATAKIHQGECSSCCHSHPPSNNKLRLFKVLGFWIRSSKPHFGLIQRRRFDDTDHI